MGAEITRTYLKIARRSRSAKMSDDSADKRAVGAHPESFSGRAHPRWTSWTQADPDPDVFSKLNCGYSTPARSGTCCRKAIRTTNPFIGAFKPGAAMKFCGEC